MNQEFSNKIQILHWSGISSHDRHTAIYRIEEILIKHGSIIDFHMYSDLEISFKIETYISKTNRLYIELQNFMNLKAFEEIHSEINNECIILLQVIFVKGKGNLKIDVPHVPG